MGESAKVPSFTKAHCCTIMSNLLHHMMLYSSLPLLEWMFDDTRIIMSHGLKRWYIVLQCSALAIQERREDSKKGYVNACFYLEAISFGLSSKCSNIVTDLQQTLYACRELAERSANEIILRTYTPFCIGYLLMVQCCALYGMKGGLWELQRKNNLKIMS